MTKTTLFAAVTLSLTAFALTTGFAHAAGVEGADLLRAEGKYREAAQAYDAVLDSEPENQAALFGSAFCLTETGRAESSADDLWNARKRIEKLVLLAPDVPDYRFLNGYNAFLVAPHSMSYYYDLMTLAENELAEVLKARTQDWQATFYLGMVKHTLGRWAAAVEDFAKAVIIDPKRLEPYPLLAQDLLAVGRPDEALNTAKALFQLAPSYLFARMIMGQAFTAKGMFDEAAQEYVAGAVEQQNDESWVRQLYLLFMTIKDYDKLAAALGELKVKTPGAEFPRRYLATLIYAINKDYEASAAEYSELRKMFPENAEYAFYLGESYRNLGKEKESLDEYLEALRLSPDWDSPYYYLRLKFNDGKFAGKFEETAALLRRISAVEPSPRLHCWVLWDLAENTRNLGLVEETIAAQKKAHELNPTEPRFLNSLGLYFRSLGRYDEAVSEFKKSIETNSGYMYTIENLAATLQQAHKDAEAVEWFEKGCNAAREQYAWAPEDDFENRSEREFDIFKFNYFLHEMENQRFEDKKKGK